MDIQDISGIGPQYEVKLAAAEITDIESLASMDPATVAASTGFSEERLRLWRDEAAERLDGSGDDLPVAREGAGRDHKFVLTLMVAGDGTVQRSSVEDARTGDQDQMAGWSVDRFVAFVTDRAGVDTTATSRPTITGQPRAAKRLDDLDHPCHLVGGRPTALEVEVGTDRLADEEVHDLRYVIRATAHEVGDPSNWRSLGDHRGVVEAPRPIRLRVDAPDLPSGFHRVQLEVAAEPADAVELLQLRAARVVTPA